jgi:L-glyceraldehyde 3-phosphate reductase
MGLEYVDIFYPHRPDPDTPLEETMQALDYAVRSGRALYVGISSYKPAEAKRAAEILRSLGTPLLIHQPVYNMFNRWIEPELLDVLEEAGAGCIPFSPLAQGLLTNRYLGGIAEGSRASKPHGFLKPAGVTDDKLARVQKLNTLAEQRGQTLAQMALAWVLRDDASPPPSSAPAARSKSTTASPPRRTSPSPPKNWHRSSRFWRSTRC